MFRTQTNQTPIPVVISLFQAMHALLVLNAVAGVGIAFFPDVSASSYNLTPDCFFAIIAAIPICAGSGIFLLATTVQVFFVSGIFFCSLLTLLLACLPLMLNVFFPMHLVVWALAAVYGISCVILARFFFARPLSQKR